MNTDCFPGSYYVLLCLTDGQHIRNQLRSGHDPELQSAKIRRLELLLGTNLCTSKRGRWYAEPWWEIWEGTEDTLGFGRLEGWKLDFGQNCSANLC